METSTPKTLSVAIPDASTLAVIDTAKMMSLKVIDSASCETAGEYKKAAQDHIKAITALFDEPKRAANAAHKLLCDLEKKLCAEALAVVNLMQSEANAYLADQEKRHTEILKLAAAAQAEEEITDLFEIPAAPVVPVLPKVSTPGFSSKFKPWHYRLKGPDETASLMSLIKSIAEGKTPLCDSFGKPIVALVDTHFKLAAKNLEAKLEDYYPGVEGFREKRTY